MASNYLSGKTGFVNVLAQPGADLGAGVGLGNVAAGGTNLAFGEWKIEMEAATPEVSNFNTTPYRSYVTGMLGATADTDMPGYDAGNTPLVCGNVYQLIFGFDSTFSIPALAILKKLGPANKADGTPSIKASWQITGAFTASVS